MNPQTPERSPLLLGFARVAGHAATLAESRKTSAFLNREADVTRVAQDE
jgi:hypothetical protein